MRSIDRKLCKRIALIRKNQGLKLIDFSETLKVSHTTISGIEKYRLEPSKKMLINIVKKFNINGTWLLNGIGEMYQNKTKSNKIIEEELPYSQEIQQLKDENKRLKKALIKLATQPDGPS